ncbi:hypothetical protein VOLCADRAFT_105959 [Volvox carteri f. nagariensis]|uniref:Uncharacterized protein n=1 Tax=Volvox carteri f. nagariensis TaxID=3068 RepID=D8U4H9_VOLCA|nr:hypothetical protein VOLCADRAFT_105959 [Volvox carteri f. nagariensis]|eukprot:XP_002953433.1 hypothetical protein VOLCADRAFT_105959 [Volvox carteri f. nagariensis]
MGGIQPKAGSDTAPDKAQFELLPALGATAEEIDTSGLPHIDSCNYCYECLPSRPLPVDTTREAAAHMRLRHLRRLSQFKSELPAGSGNLISTVEGVQDSAWASEVDPDYEAASAASGIPGALANPNLIHPDLIRPLDHDEKQLKPNCTRCTGCTTLLTDMHAAPVEADGLGGVAFMHGKGATNGWLFFGNVPGSSKRFIVKVYCMPYSKNHGRPMECASSVYTERMRLMMAQVRLADECGAPGLTPRVWVAPVNAIIPNGTFLGYHVRWYGLWMEEAPGITLHGLWVTRGAENVMYDLLTNKINKTQHWAHKQHWARSVVRYHTQLRLGYWGTPMTFYETHGSKPNFCTGPIDMRVVIDYRCYVPEGRIGHDYFPQMRLCMKALARHPVPDIMQRYGFTSRKPAEILKRRSRDMLTLGFEGALESSPPRSAPRYVYRPQPPCCNVVLDMSGMPKCANCWQPIIEYQKDGVKDVAGKATEVLVQPWE